MIIAPILFALLYRLRGGPWSWKYWLSGGTGGTFWARALWWALPNAITGYILFGIWGLLLGPAAYISLLWVFAHGDNQGAKSWMDIGLLTIRGAGRGCLFDGVAWLATGQYLPIYAIAGLFMGPAYMLAWDWLEHITIGFPRWLVNILPKQWRDDDFIEVPTSWGEVLTGFCWGVAHMVWWFVCD